MLIVHVVTLVTPGAAYGGPVRVSVNQLKELSARGHTVVLVGGHCGYGSNGPPDCIDGVPARLFPVYRIVPKSGFAGLVSPGVCRWLRRKAAIIDVAHVHLSRELITLSAAQVLLSSGVPMVAQTHGMIVESSHPFAQPLDIVLTRRLLRQSKAVLYLTIAEKRSLQRVAAAPLALVHLRNGVPLQPMEHLRELPDQRLVEVLFMARLHRRKRPDVFVRAAAELASHFPNVRFTLVGPDEGMGATVCDLIAGAGLESRIKWEGPIDPADTLDRLKRATIYALPSVDEPFGMAVLEAMSVGRSVIVTDSCGLSDDVIAAKAGLVVGPAQDAFTESLRTLLADRQLCDSMGQNGRDLVESRFGMAPVVDSLIKSYECARLVRSHA